jgi:hypothetical protein
MELFSLIGFLLPPLIDLINRKVGDSDARFWISVSICMLVGVGFEYISNGMAFLGVEPTVSSIFEMIGIAQISYKALWEGNPIRVKLDLKATDTPKVELPDIIEGGD